jgi:uncharacterized protein (UPF0248 family)
MQPLQDLLHRIQWDSAFGRGDFTLGYDDRVEHEERIVPFSSVRLETGRPGAFSWQDPEKGVRHIPLHRVRTVYKDGIAIWQRPDRRTSSMRRRHGKRLPDA